MILVGDEPYYGKCGFKRVPPGRASMPGPVDPARLLVAELADGAFDGVSGPIRASGKRNRIRVAVLSSFRHPEVAAQRPIKDAELRCLDYRRSRPGAAR